MIKSLKYRSEFLEDLHRHSINGDVHYVFKFPNNFGVSIFECSFAKRKKMDDRWELCVIWFDSYGNYGRASKNDTPYSVLHYLTDDQVNEVLREIKSL